MWPRNSAMKMLVNMAVFLTLVLAIWRAVSKSQIDRAISATVDDRYPEPFRGSEVSHKLIRACANCHSNRTSWPWYSNVAPVSWWIQRHVREGRKELNFSEWTSYSARQRHNDLEEICGVVSTGRMPPVSYIAMHPQARLASGDKKAVCVWAASEIEREKRSVLNQRSCN